MLKEHFFRKTVIFMEIKAAIFDMDGTLVDSLMIWNVLWAKLGKRFLNDDSFMPSEADDRKVRTLTLKDAMTLIHNNYGIGAGGEELLDIANSLIADFYTNEVKLKDGVKEFLEALKGNGVKMCVASATARDLVDMAMEHCGIKHYFLKVFSCGEIGKGKEKPDVFLMAADFLGEDIANTCVFEDSLVAINTARSIGMLTVGIYDKYNFGHEKIKEISTEYIAEGETLLKIL